MYLQVCVVRTAENALKFFDAHDPVPASAGGSLRMQLRHESTAVALQFCRRCGVTYIESHERTFQKAQPIQEPPTPDEVS